MNECLDTCWVMLRDQYIPLLRNKIDLGGPRLPQMPLSSTGLSTLDSQLKNIGFYQWS
jgi:hypothetical protein